VRSPKPVELSRSAAASQRKLLPLVSGPSHWWVNPYWQCWNRSVPKNVMAQTRLFCSHWGCATSQGTERGGDEGLASTGIPRSKSGPFLQAPVTPYAIEATFAFCGKSGPSLSLKLPPPPEKWQTAYFIAGLPTFNRYALVYTHVRVQALLLVSITLLSISLGPSWSCIDPSCCEYADHKRQQVVEEH